MVTLPGFRQKSKTPSTLRLACWEVRVAGGYVEYSTLIRTSLNHSKSVCVATGVSIFYFFHHERAQIPYPDIYGLLLAHDTKISVPYMGAHLCGQISSCHGWATSPSIQIYGDWIRQARLLLSSSPSHIISFFFFF